MKNLKNLEHLSIDNNKISDITPLKELKKIYDLKIGNNQIGDISVIEKFNHLSYFNAKNQTITTTTEAGKKISLPKIFISAQNSKSIINDCLNEYYPEKASDDEDGDSGYRQIEYEKIATSNAKLNSNKTKITITNDKNKQKAIIKIIGGPLNESTFTIKIKPRKTKIKKISSKNRKISLKWKKIKESNGYEIYRATKNNGKYNKVKTIKNAKTIKYTTKKLTKNKKYYFKIRSYRKIDGKKIYSSWSKTKNIKVK